MKSREVLDRLMTLGQLRDIVATNPHVAIAHNGDLHCLRGIKVESAFSGIQLKIERVQTLDFPELDLVEALEQIPRDNEKRVISIPRGVNVFLADPAKDYTKITRFGSEVVVLKTRVGIKNTQVDPKTVPRADIEKWLNTLVQGDADAEADIDKQFDDHFGTIGGLPGDKWIRYRDVWYNTWTDFYEKYPMYRVSDIDVIRDQWFRRVGQDRNIYIEPDCKKHLDLMELCLAQVETLIRTKDDTNAPCIRCGKHHA